MVEKEFNLLEEPWIRVLDFRNNVIEVSLIDLFENAHCYRQLAGETVTQDAAIFRVLLAVVATVFYRYDAEGNELGVLDVLMPEDEVLDRWQAYWNKGRFNGKVFREYLEKYKERFYLFHPETPFWQVNEISGEATKYGVINLYGNIKESNNAATRHHFHVRDGNSAENLSYSEAARWVIYNNAYSVNVKTKVGGENKATGVGRLGQLGLLIADEDNLYRILLTNLCALDWNGKAWGKPNPIWEQEVRKKPGEEIVPPDNLPEIYTIQSRRLLLKCENGRIAGFSSIGGDYYSTVNDLREPMTLLQYKEKDKNIVPRRHKKEVMAWRELPSILADSDKTTPGLVAWIKYLKDSRLLAKSKYITFRMIGLEYGDGMSYTNGEIFNQSLSMSKELLRDMGDIWVRRVNDEVKNCEEVVNKVFYSFSKSICENLYKGDSQQRKRISESLAGEYYFRVDKGFRDWLISISPENDSLDEKTKEWEKQSADIATDVMERFVSGLCPQNMMLAADAVNLFKVGLSKLYRLTNGERRDKDEQKKGN